MVSTWFPIFNIHIQKFIFSSILKFYLIHPHTTLRQTLLYSYIGVMNKMYIGKLVGLFNSSLSIKEKWAIDRELIVSEDVHFFMNCMIFI